MVHDNFDILFIFFLCCKEIRYIDMKSTLEFEFILFIFVFSWCSMRLCSHSRHNMRSWSSWDGAHSVRWSSAGRKAPVILWPSRSSKTTPHMPDRDRLRWAWILSLCASDADYYICYNLWDVTCFISFTINILVLWSSLDYILKNF